MLAPRSVLAITHPDILRVAPRKDPATEESAGSRAADIHQGYLAGREGADIPVIFIVRRCTLRTGLAGRDVTTFRPSGLSTYGRDSRCRKDRGNEQAEKQASVARQKVIEALLGHHGVFSRLCCAYELWPLQAVLRAVWSPTSYPWRTSRESEKLAFDSRPVSQGAGGSTSKTAKSAGWSLSGPASFVSAASSSVLAVASRVEVGVDDVEDGTLRRAHACEAETTRESSRSSAKDFIVPGRPTARRVATGISARAAIDARLACVLRGHAAARKPVPCVAAGAARKLFPALASSESVG